MTSRQKAIDTKLRLHPYFRDAVRSAIDELRHEQLGHSVVMRLASFPEGTTHYLCMKIPEGIAYAVYEPRSPHKGLHPPKARVLAYVEWV